MGGSGGSEDVAPEASDDTPGVDASDAGHDAVEGGGGIDAGTDTMTLHTGLIGYWKLDSNTGSVAADSSGLGNNGTIDQVPMLVMTGLPANLTFDKGAFSFSAADDAVRVPDTPSLRPTALTVALWVKFASNSNHLGCGGPPSTLQFLFYRSNARTSGSVEGVALTRTQDNQFGFILGDNAGDRTELVGLPQGSATVSTGVWYHVVATFDGMQMRLYVNGALAANPNTATTTAVFPRTLPPEYGTRPLFLARSGECLTAEGIGVVDWDAQLNGTLDDVRFYNRALTALEVKALSLGQDL